LAFHEHGWRGIHVEPTPHYAELLRQQRPGDTVIQVAVGAGSAVIKFFEIPDTGISTADPSIAQQHRERGFNVLEITVPSISLSDIFESCVEPEIHWLKIDVEGLEQQVLSSWGKSVARPWIVVVESTLPLTQIETHETWESILVGYGYTPVYFDGLNRYYISSTHLELKNSFLAPPNVFDGFTLNGTASATFHHLIDARYKEKIGEMLAKNEQHRQSAVNEIERLNLSFASLDKVHAEQTSQTRQELENILRSQTQREKEFVSQLLAVQQQANQEKTELFRNYSEQERTLRLQHAEREQTFAQQVQAGQQELRRLEQEQGQRGIEHAEQINQIQHKLESYLCTRAQREQEVAAQLLSIQQHAHQEKVELVRSQNEQAGALRHQFDEQLRVEREASQQLQQVLNTLQSELVTMRNNLFWRVTAPLRAVAARFKSTFTQTEYVNRFAGQSVVASVAQPVSDTAPTAQAVAISHQYGEAMSTTTNHLASAPQISAATSLKALLQLDDAQFIERAYRMLLKRPSDPDGFNYYIGRIRAGVHKVKILGQIVNSREARQFGVEIPGLHKAIRQQKIISLPLVGRVFQLFMGSTSDAAMSLNELLMRHNKEFIEGAYMTLLKRVPDHEGYNYYLGRLQTGVSKIRILGQLLDSREARASGVELPGLRVAVMRQRIARLPLVGAIFKIFVEVEGNSVFETRLRALEQQVFLFGKNASVRFDKIEQSMNTLRMVGVTPVTPDIASVQAIDSNKTEPADLNMLPARVRDIYKKLKLAVARHAEGVV
jgi:FkbM family methyltransferase